MLYLLNDKIKFVLSMDVRWSAQNMYLGWVRQSNIEWKTCYLQCKQFHLFDSMLFGQVKWVVSSDAVEIFFGQRWLSPLPLEKLASMPMVWTQNVRNTHRVR